MIVIEAACLAIVGAHVLPRLGRPGFAVRYAAIVLASWAGEESCIRLYGFYAYDPAWSIFVGRVPLLVPLIWPVVILSASDLAGALAPRRRALATALVVLADAALIEPVAVAAGLWSWNAPGLFAVPPIGVLGWSYFAGLVAAGDRRPLPAAAAAVAGSHVLLLASWWAGLRLGGTIPPVAALAIAWPAALALAARWLTRARPPVRPALVWSRAPGALFFVALAAGHGNPVLWAWVAAFTVPYLALALGSIGRLGPCDRSSPSSSSP